jgi:outer membrane protein TolC
MTRKRNLFVAFLALVACLPIQGQQDSLVLDFDSFLTRVKMYHPVARQAQLVAGTGEARLQESRGGFDPKLEVDYDRKEFDGSTYYDRLNAAFKIPTWYGVELKGQFEQNEGDYLNPSESIPTDGLYSAGISVSLARGLWTNERMATLRKAQFFEQQSQADRDLLINQILYDASEAYFAWLQAYRDQQVYSRFLENADLRLRGIRQSALTGELAAIDTVEARIALENRALSLEQARVRLRGAALELSNFLWTEEDVPLELRETVRPEAAPIVDEALQLSRFSADSLDLSVHPKMRSLEFKIQGLEVEKRLKVNQLLPEINLEYNFLTETPDRIASFETQQYKGGLSFRMPLFLRKERGALKIAQFKLQDARLERDNAQLSIRNKVSAIRYELTSFERQNTLIDQIVGNYERLLQAEERKFSFGESSLFLINSRERSLIDARLKANEVQNKYLMAKAKLFQVLAINPESNP